MRKNTLVVFATISFLVLLAMIIAGCGGAGGGGRSSPFAGNWDGAWTNPTGVDTGMFDVRVANNGSISGDAWGDVCRNSGKVSGRFTTTSTEVKINFRENSSCYAYTVVAQGGELEPYSRGYAARLSARFYKDGVYLGIEDYAIYIEERGRDGEAKITLIKPNHTAGNDVNIIEQLKLNH